jgi:hypothetical protein
MVKVYEVPTVAESPVIGVERVTELEGLDPDDELAETVKLRTC